MKRSTTIPSRVRPALLAIVLLSFLANSFNFSSIYPEISAYHLNKKTSAGADAGLPSEEKEKEVEKGEENKENETFLAALIREVSLCSVLKLRSFHSISSRADLAESHHLPLYLSLRTLLI